jgi:hypothetical protein
LCHVLVAAGRTPNTEGLGPEFASVELTDRGYVKVNERLQTTAAGLNCSTIRGNSKVARGCARPQLFGASFKLLFYLRTIRMGHRVDFSVDGRGRSDGV